MLIIPEIFCHRKARKAYSHSYSGSFIHLSEYQCCLAQNAAGFHLVPQVISFSGTLTYTCKNGISAMFHGDIVYKLLNKHRPVFPFLSGAKL